MGRRKKNKRRQTTKICQNGSTPKCCSTRQLLRAHVLLSSTSNWFCGLCMNVSVWVCNGWMKRLNLREREREREREKEDWNPTWRWWSKKISSNIQVNVQTSPKNSRSFVTLTSGDDCGYSPTRHQIEPKNDEMKCVTHCYVEQEKEERESKRKIL